MRTLGRTIFALMLVAFPAAPVVAGDGYGPWQVHAPPVYEVGLRAVAHDGRRFVAVADSGVFSSSDGLSWNEVPGPELRYWPAMADVTTDGRQFVAVGAAYGGVFIIDDAASWRMVGGVGSFAGVAWNGESFVAVGYNGSAVSHDGHDWTTSWLHWIGFRSVCWDGAQWIAVGITSPAMSSTDGLSWSQQDGVEFRAQAVASNGLQTIAVGRNGSIIVRDGDQPWVRIESGLSEDLRDVAWIGQQWLVTGHGGLIASSDDGFSWELTTRAPYGVYGVTRGGERLVAVGGAISTAVDSSGPWQTVGCSRPRAPQILRDGDRFLALSEHQIFTSLDGLLWERFDRQPPSTHADDIASNGSIYVVVGFTVMCYSHGPCITSAMISTSADATTWDRHLPYDCDTGSDRPGLRAVTWHKDRFVAVGDLGAAVSTDGVCWMWGELPAHATDVLWDGRRFVAMANEGSLVSDSGLSWDGPYPVWDESLPWGLWGEGAPSLASNGSAYVAVGPGGQLAASKDAVHWSLVETGIEGDFTDVIWTGSRWLAAATGWTILSSPDGVTWTAEDLGWDPPPGHPDYPDSPPSGFKLGCGPDQVVARGYGVSLVQERRGPWSPVERHDLLQPNRP